MANNLIKVPNTINLYYKEMQEDYQGNYGSRVKNFKRYTLRFLDERGKRRQEEIGDDLKKDQLKKIQDDKIIAIERLRAKLNKPKKSRKRLPSIILPKTPDFAITIFDDLANFYFIKNPDKKTIDRDKREYEIYIKDLFGNQDASTLAVEDVKVFYLDLKKRLSLKKAGDIILSMKKFYNYAIKNKKYKRENPLDEIKITNPDNTRTNYLNKDQIHKLISHPKISDNLDLLIFVLIATRTGARAGSIMKIVRDDISLENHSVLLHNYKKNAEEKKEYTSFFDNQTKDALSKRFESCEKYEKIIQSSYASLRKKVQRILDELFNYSDRDNNVELDKKGCVIDSKKVLYSKKDLISDVNLSEEEIIIRAKRRKNRIVIHSLRHSFAYNFLKQPNASVFKLKELLNHSDIKMTLRYSHDEEEESKAILKDMYN
jgi:site-specific recombinase XerD